MASAGPPEHRRPRLIDINLASVGRGRKEERPPIPLFTVAVVFLILVLAYAIFPFAALAEDYDIPNLYGLWDEQRDDIKSLEDTLAEREAYRVWLMELAGEAGDLNEMIDALESLLVAMEQDYTTLSQDRVTWSEVLGEIEDAAPAGVSITSVIQGSDVEIEGTAATDELISEYAAALADTGLFSKVEITEHELAETTAPSDIIIDTCDSKWSPSQILVFTWVDPVDYKLAPASAKQGITAPFSTGLVAYQNVSQDLRQAEDVLFWVKSDTDQPAGIFQLVFYSPPFPFVGPTLDPTIEYDPVALFFTTTEGTNPPTQTLRIRNSGGLTLNWTVTDDAGPPDWLTLSPPSGDSTGEWDYVTLTVDVVTTSMGASDDSYTATITISGPGATNTPQSVPVYLKIDPFVTPTPTPTPTAWPTIDYSPLSFCSSAREGVGPATQTLRIRNSGGGTLNWWVSASPASWLSLNPSSGSSTTEWDDVTLMVDVTGPPVMSAGSYIAIITIDGTDNATPPNPATNAPQKLVVYLTVGSPTPVERFNIPALAADTWTRVIRPLTSPSDFCYDLSVALETTTDPGACAVWLDDIRASVEATPGPYEFLITVTLAGGGE